MIRKPEKLKKQFTDLASLSASRIEAEECRTVKSLDCANTTKNHMKHLSPKERIFPNPDIQLRDNRDTSKSAKYVG